MLCSLSRPVESHSGARENILAEPPNIFTGPLWEQKFGILFLKWYILAYFINFWPTAGPPKRRGAQGS